MSSDDVEGWARLTAHRKERLKEVIDLHERYKGAYFWRPHTHAAQRRAAEWSNRLVFTYGGHEYSISQAYQESCRNCYYTCKIWVDGQKKDIRAVKKILGVA